MLYMSETSETSASGSGSPSDTRNVSKGNAGRGGKLNAVIEKKRISKRPI